MIKQAINEVFKGIRRGNSSALFNMINLILGFTAFILISIVVNHEISYERIYWVQTMQEDS